MDICDWNYSLPGVDLSRLPRNLQEIYDLENKIPIESGLFSLISVSEQVFGKVIAALVKNVFLRICIIPVNEPDDSSFSTPLHPSLGRPGELLHYKITNANISIPYRPELTNRALIKEHKAGFLNQQLGSHGLALIHLIAIQGRNRSFNVLCETIKETFGETPKPAVMVKEGGASRLVSGRQFTVINLDLQDDRGFTGAHHAAIHRNMELIRMLQNNGALLGKIYNFRAAGAVHLLEMCYPEKEKWSRYPDKTYNFPILVHPSEIAIDWSIGKKELSQDTTGHWFSHYLRAFKENSSHSTNIFNLPTSIEIFASADPDFKDMGVRVRATKKIEKGEIIGYYGGLVFSSPRERVSLENDLYTFGLSYETETPTTESMQTLISGHNGPFTSRIEDGFPNIINFSEHACGGLQKMLCFVAADVIPKGAPLRFNYGGFHSVKSYHIETSMPEVEIFVRGLDIDKFLMQLTGLDLSETPEDLESAKKITLELLERELFFSRIIYLFETPTTFVEILGKVPFSKEVFAKWFSVFKRVRTYPRNILRIADLIKRLYDSTDDTTELLPVFQKISENLKIRRREAKESKVPLNSILFIKGLLEFIEANSISAFLSM